MHDREETRRIQWECRDWYEENYQLPYYSWNDAPTAYRYHAGGIKEVIEHPGVAFGECHVPEVCLYTGSHQCLDSPEYWINNLDGIEIYSYKDLSGEVLATVYEGGRSYLLCEREYGTLVVFEDLAALLDYTNDTVISPVGDAA